jgi:hypothetical protein
MVFNPFTSFLNRSLNAIGHCVRMTAIPHAALALTSALGRFELAGSRLLEAATGAAGDQGAAIVDMIEAKAQFSAGVAVLSFSNEMWNALIELAREPQR